MAVKKTTSRKKVAATAIPYEAFAGGISRAALAPVIVLAGAEDMRRCQAIALIKKRAEALGGSLALKETLCPQNAGELSSFAMADVLDYLRSRSLFGGYNLAVLRLADFALGSGGGNRLNLLLDYLASPAPQAGVVVELAKSDAKSSVAKKLGAFGTLVDCRSLFDKPAPWQTGAKATESELTQWIVAHARERYGKRITKEAAYELAQMTGTGLARLSNELNKLASFVGDGCDEIAIADIEKSAGHIRTHGLFALIDAVSERKAGEAMATLRAMFERGLAMGADEPVTDAQGVAIILVNWLHRRIKQLARVRAMLDAGADVGEIKAAMKYRMDFQATRIAAQAQNFSREDFPPMFRALLDADLALKSSPSPPESVLERLLAVLCG